MESNWGKVKEELTCAMCKHLLDDPKILPCLHSFCTGCLKEKSDKLANLDPSKRHLQCPLCKAEVLLSTSQSVEELPSHFSATRLVEIVRLQEQANQDTPICRNCKKGDQVVATCIECNKCLCEFCKEAHQVIVETSEHTIYSLDEINASEVPFILPEKVEMCPAHPTKPLELYCKCEEVLICHDCIIKKHKDHDYDVISDVVEGEKKILREALPGIQQLVGELENAVTRVKGRRKIVDIRKKENLKKLDDTFHILHAALDKHQKELREKVTKDSNKKDKGLQVQEDELCFLLSQLKSCHSFIEDKVQRGVNQDVLAMKRSILERRDKLKEVKNKTKLRPVVQYPLPIKLKDMDEVVKLISQLTE